jgi:hypothetical protein
VSPRRLPPAAALLPSWLPSIIRGLVIMTAALVLPLLPLLLPLLLPPPPCLGLASVVTLLPLGAPSTPSPHSPSRTTSSPRHLASQRLPRVLPAAVHTGRHTMGHTQLAALLGAPPPPLLLPVLPPLPPLGAAAGLRHRPCAATATPSQRASHALLYDLPLAPHTGSYARGQPHAGGGGGGGGGGGAGCCCAPPPPRAWRELSATTAFAALPPERPPLAPSGAASAEGLAALLLWLCACAAPAGQGPAV